MRARKLLDSANGQACVRCGSQDGTVCARHYNGRRQHALGKGMGVKCHDLATAELCRECDRLFTEGRLDGWTDKQERSEHFLHYIVVTNMRRFDRGDLKQ